MKGVTELTDNSENKNPIQALAEGAGISSPRIDRQNDVEEEVVDLGVTHILKKTALSLSQKSAIIQLFEVDKNFDGKFDKQEMEKATEVFNNIKSSMMSSYANIAIVSALIGVTTYGLLLNPISVSTLDPSSADNDELAVLSRKYTILNAASTSFSLVAIVTCLMYSFVISIFLPTTEDIIWFILHVPSVLICTILMQLGLYLAIAALVFGLYIIYSKDTANACVVVVLIPAGLFVLLWLHMFIPSISRLNDKMHANMMRYAKKNVILS